MNELQDFRSVIVKILGGGQLALLSEIVAQQMGYNIKIASENPRCPAVIGSNFYLSNNL
jgi:phosphoribosylaminoimidazole carboxylase (NCAIR synthetase)